MNFSASATKFASALSDNASIINKDETLRES